LHFRSGSPVAAPRVPDLRPVFPVPPAEAGAPAAVAAAQHLARDPAKSADVGQALLLLAQAQQALGRHAEAVTSATRAVSSLTAGLSEDHPLTRQALAIIGR
jgi:hypothetical protein